LQPSDTRRQARPCTRGSHPSRTPRRAERELPSRHKHPASSPNPSIAGAPNRTTARRTANSSTRTHPVVGTSCYLPRPRPRPALLTPPGPWRRTRSDRPPRPSAPDQRRPRRCRSGTGRRPRHEGRGSAARSGPDAGACAT